LVDRLVEELRRLERAQVGPNSTFEERQDFGFEILVDVLRKKTDLDLRESVTTAEEVEVDEQRFRRLKQSSSATYFSRWGAHHIEESLYREVGVHNGRTVKPIEVRLGLVENMTPDLARIVGELSAERSSRPVARTLKVVGFAAPSRSFLEDHVSRMSREMAELAPDLEAHARASQPLPAGIASVSCGLDRMAVRMAEEIEGTLCTRDEPYQRSPPPQKEYHYRQAWVGSVTTYNAEGEALGTWRYGVEASADPAGLAERVAADVKRVVMSAPEVAVHCIQDAAPALLVLPKVLQRDLPPNTARVDLVDFEHLAGYFDAIVDACQPVDPDAHKRRYRAELLEDDNAIDRIQRRLRDLGRQLSKGATGTREAVAAALRYIRKRKHLMRYATHYRANRPIGSGATENTCWQMQERVKLPGQSWGEPGLRGLLAMRGLVLSGRWAPAWTLFAELHRATVHIVQ
jgi:hypothetical protein